MSCACVCRSLEGTCLICIDTRDQFSPYRSLEGTVKAPCIMEFSQIFLKQALSAEVRTPQSMVLAGTFPGSFHKIWSSQCNTACCMQ